MKNIFSAVGLVLTSLTLSAQCTLTGLNSFYCSTDTISVLSASCSGTPTIFGPGINANGNFNPANAGTGQIEIYVLNGSPSYTIEQSTALDTIGPPSSAASVSLSDDDVTSSLSIGFTFNFFATAYTTFKISSNGFIFFGTGTDNGCCSGQSLPNSNTPNNLIAFAWEDLNPSSGGSIQYYTVGTAPNRRLVVDFDGVHHYGSTVYNVTSQVHLLEGCGRIEIHTTSMPSNGGNHTMGIENASGTVAYTVSGRNAANWSATTDFVAFQPICGDTFTTYVSGGPDITLEMDSLTCYGDTNGSLTANAIGFEPITYLWSNGATTATISGLSNGTYSVTATDSAGCSNVESINMYSPSSITANFSVTNTHCESDANGAISLTAGGGTPPYSYAWSAGGTTTSISNLVIGTYTVTITDALGCDIDLNSNVNYNNADPNINLGADKSICPGQSTVLVAPPGFASYNWSDGSTGNSTVISAAGTYSLTATNVAGCSGEDEITVTLNVPDQVDLGGNKYGLGPIALDAGPQYTSYFWNTGATGQVLNVSITGNYSVTVQDTLGCLTKDTVNVKIWPTGINDLANYNVDVFPNPTEGMLTIRFNDQAAIGTANIYDLSGRKLMQVSINSDKTSSANIDLGGLANGSYIIELDTEAFKAQRVIIKQ